MLLQHVIPFQQDKTPKCLGHTHIAHCCPLCKPCTCWTLYRCRRSFSKVWGNFIVIENLSGYIVFVDLYSVWPVICLDSTYHTILSMKEHSFLRFLIGLVLSFSPHHNMKTISLQLEHSLQSFYS